MSTAFISDGKSLAQRLPVKFALVEPGAASRRAPMHGELILISGERLRIEPGLDSSVLRAALSLLR